MLDTRHINYIMKCYGLRELYLLRVKSYHILPSTIPCEEILIANKSLIIIYAPSSIHITCFVRWKVLTTNA